jgi:dipeptidyl aminopeptidase/acylaminoacyl peptidase
LSRRARIAYGDHGSQFGELHLPDGEPRGVVVVIHGGFWRARHDLSLGTPLALDLAGRGLAVWNIEYRRLGDGGGWPATGDDVQAAFGTLDTVPAVAGLPVVALGHSAGGHLACWLAGQVGPDRLAGVVSQAGVLDLEAAAAARLGAGVTLDLLGGSPDEVPEHYRDASPIRRLPIGVPVRCIHGDADDTVPLSQSADFMAAAGAAGDDCALTLLPGAGHYDVITIDDPAWARSVCALEELLSQ